MHTIKTFITSAWGKWVILLSVFLGLGVAAGLYILTQGLAATNLTDLVPWGLWIAIDLSSIAIAGGAFFLCAGVYLLGLKKYEPVARTATFIGLAGYTMAMFALLLDIGRPDRFWHALIYWNKHSLLWEVTMCVILYLTVLLLEVLPIAVFLRVAPHPLSLAGFEDGKRPPHCALPGDRRLVPFHAAPILAGRGVRSPEIPPDLVSSGRGRALHYVSQ